LQVYQAISGLTYLIWYAKVEILTYKAILIDIDSISTIMILMTIFL